MSTYLQQVAKLQDCLDDFVNGGSLTSDDGYLMATYDNQSHMLTQKLLKGSMPDIYKY